MIISRCAKWESNFWYALVGRGRIAETGKKGDCIMANEFSESLKRIRKEKGVTQEQLADAVGVSAQAVSKWEQGSFPDASLLPAIADYLGVRIDTLFGLKEEKFDLEDLIVRELDSAERDEDGNIIYGAEGEKRRMQCVWRLCHLLACTYMRCSNIREFSRMTIEGNIWKDAFMQIVDEGGFLQAKLNESLRYFLIIPQPEEGYDNPDALAYCKDTEKLFQFLGRPNVLRVLIFLAEQNGRTFFDYNTLKEELGIEHGNAKEIVDGLLDFHLVVQAELKRESKNETIYQYKLDCNLISFLTFARILVNPPHNYSVCIHNRSTPYFSHSTYKKPVEGEIDRK